MADFHQKLLLQKHMLSHVCFHDITLRGQTQKSKSGQILTHIVETLHLCLPHSQGKREIVVIPAQHWAFGEKTKITMKLKCFSSYE